MRSSSIPHANSLPLLDTQGQAPDRQAGPGVEVRGWALYSNRLLSAGFDDIDWEKAVKFAEDLAKTLNIEYIGEVGEADHGLNHIDEGKEE